MEADDKVNFYFIATGKRNVPEDLYSEIKGTMGIDIETNTDEQQSPIEPFDCDDSDESEDFIDLISGFERFSSKLEAIMKSNTKKDRELVRMLFKTSDKLCPSSFLSAIATFGKEYTVEDSNTTIPKCFQRNTIIETQPSAAGRRQFKGTAKRPVTAGAKPKGFLGQPLNKNQDTKVPKKNAAKRKNSIEAARKLNVPNAKRHKKNMN